MSAAEKECDNFKRYLQTEDAEQKLCETTFKDKYGTQLRYHDETIDRLKKMKAKLSTRMIDETLEQHREIEFNKLCVIAFPNAYFEKDNDASNGSTSDYIFKESDDASAEIISIMFEMKNEAYATASENEDLFKELHKATTRKGCEHTALIILL